MNTQLNPNSPETTIDIEVSTKTGIFDTTKGSTELISTREDRLFSANQFALGFVRVIKLPTAR